MRYAFTLFVALIMLSGCAERASDILDIPNIYIEKQKSGNFEIIIEHNQVIRAHPCVILEQPIRRIFHQYIYVKAVFGKIEAKDIILKHSKKSLPQSGLKGYVIFTEREMEINLSVPNYRNDSTIEKYVDYELNGKYETSSHFKYIDEYIK